MVRRMLVGIAMAVALASVSAETATAAGTYTVWSCRGPQGELVSSAAWRSGSTAGTAVDTCATGGSLSAALGLADTAADAVSGFRFVVPAGVRIASARIWMSARTTSTGGDGYAAGPALDRGVSVGPVVGGCPRVPPPGSGCTFPSVPGEDLVTVTGPADGLAFVVRCTEAMSCVPETAVDPPAAASLSRSAVDLADLEAPVVEAPRVREAVAGHTTLEVSAGDAGGGIASTTLVVDGTPVAVQSGTGDCREPYTTAAPCPGKGRWIFDVGTAAAAPGAHDAVARVTDAAGNVTDSASTTFVLAPGPETPPVVDPPVVDPPVVDPPVVKPPPGPVPVVVRLSSASARIALPSKGPIVGTVRRTDGTPVVGLRLTLREAGLDANRRTWKSAGSVVTGEDGTFRVAAGSVSRMLRLTPDGTEFGAEPIVLTLVRPLRVSLQKPRARLRNGRQLTLRGRLTGAGADARGRTTVVQAMVDGRWQDVDSVSPSTSGKVTWRYRFRHTTQPAIYRFRLRVPAQSGLPWKTVSSARVSVRVDP